MDGEDRFVRLDDGDIHVVEDGRPGAPAVLLIHGTAASVTWWDPVISRLADACRVIRVDLAGHGRSTAPAGGYDIPAQARRAGAVLDQLGAGQVTAIGHSTGGCVATALAEQRPGLVSALVLIDIGPDLDAYMSQGLLGRLLLASLPGRLLWRLRTEATIRKALAGAFTRPVDIPHTIIEATMRMTHQALATTSRASDDYLKQGTFPAVSPRWACRYWSSSAPTTTAAAHLRPPPTAHARRPRRAAAGCGTQPDAGRPANDRKLVLDFAAAAGSAADSYPAIAVPTPEVTRRPSGLSPGGIAGCRTRHSACHPPHHGAHGEWRLIGDMRVL